MIYRKIDVVRNPFKITELPPMALFCKYWFDNLPRRKIIGKISRACFINLFRLGVNSYGKFIFNGTQTVQFNARNTQFSSIYLEQFKDSYESEIGVLLDLLVPYNGVFYDVGSNFGYFSLYVASKSGFKGQIYSFEPHPHSYLDLLSMIEQTSLKEIVTPNCIGAHLNNETVYIKPSSARSGNFSIVDKSDSEKDAFQVELRRLDDLNFSQPDLIKIDVEGNEEKVLRGCDQIIAKSTPHIIFESSLCYERPQQTIGPFDVLGEKGYIFFYVGWFKNFENVKRGIILNVDSIDTKDKKMIALSLLNPEQRFLFSERLNILAIHKTKYDKFRNLFEG